MDCGLGLSQADNSDLFLQVMGLISPAGVSHQTRAEFSLSSLSGALDSGGSVSSSCSQRVEPSSSLPALSNLPSPQPYGPASFYSMEHSAPYQYSQYGQSKIIIQSDLLHSYVLHLLLVCVVVVSVRALISECVCVWFWLASFADCILYLSSLPRIIFCSLFTPFSQ